MKTHLIAGLAVVALASALSGTSAKAADPHCQYGFSTIAKTGWLLKCRKTVSLSSLAQTQGQAAHATCRTNSYWNYGPNVTTQIRHARRQAVITYVCGHVEG